MAGGVGGYTLPDNDAGTEVKVSFHNVKQLFLTLLRGAIVEDGDGERVGHSDSIGHLVQQKHRHTVTNPLCTAPSLLTLLLGYIMLWFHILHSIVSN